VSKPNSTHFHVTEDLTLSSAKELNIFDTYIDLPLRKYEDYNLSISLPNLTLPFQVKLIQN